MVGNNHISWRIQTDDIIVIQYEARGIFCPDTTRAVKSSNAVTTGNGTGIKNVLKLNCALQFVFSIQSSVYGITTVA